MRIVSFTRSVFQQQVPDAPTCIRIDPSSRFIQNHNLRASNKSQGHWQLPLHPTYTDNRKNMLEWHLSCFLISKVKLFHSISTFSIFTLTGQGAGAGLSFVRQPDIVHDLLHLSLHLLLRQPLQTAVEPDVFLNRQPGSQQVNKSHIYQHTGGTMRAKNVLIWDTYMLKSTLCCGQTPRFCRMVLSSVRMSLPRM